MTKIKLTLFTIAALSIFFLIFNSLRLEQEIVVLESRVEKLSSSKSLLERDLNDCRKSKESALDSCQSAKKKVFELEKSKNDIENSLKKDIKKLEEVLNGYNKQADPNALDPKLSGMLNDFCERSNKGSPCPAP